MITLESVRKSYDDEVSIGPVDLQIPAGGVTALVGPNGAGKSTLLTMIGRLLGMDSGAISVAGFDVSSTKSKDLAKIVSILRQENHFITRLTIRLVLSGHAHGGQVRLPLIGPLFAPHQGWFPALTEGVHRQGDTAMVISRGLGNSVVGVRVNNPRELVVVDLVLESPQG